MNIGEWGYEYRIPNMHIVLGSSYNFGSSKDYFSQIEISQALEDREYIYIVKNISKLSGEGAITRINSGLKTDKYKKKERRIRLVNRLNSKSIYYDNQDWMVLSKIDKSDLIKEERHNNIFYNLTKDIINYSFTIEDIIAEDNMDFCL